MSETADYDPGPWRGHDFASARVAYDAHAGRSFADAQSSGKRSSDLLPASVSTNSESPVIIICDVTGSMGEWPAQIFSKLPYLDIEGKQYLGQDMEICFAAVGDANSDQYPLQVRPFAKGLEMKDQLNQLIIEGNGGGQTAESYELAALYFALNLKTPRAKRRPIVIFIGDEQPYSMIGREYAKTYAQVTLNQNMSDKDAFEELMENCSVYLVRKRYSRAASEIDIKRHWVSLLGEDRIAELPDAYRIVDVIFGILARETDRVEYFHTEIEDRQRPDQVSTVYRSLETIHTPVADHSGKSKMLRPSGGTESKSLLDG